jgi:hypothetical protein
LVQSGRTRATSVASHKNKNKVRGINHAFVLEQTWKRKFLQQGSDTSLYNLIPSLLRIQSIKTLLQFGQHFRFPMGVDCVFRVDFLRISIAQSNYVVPWTDRSYFQAPFVPPPVTRRSVKCVGRTRTADRKSIGPDSISRKFDSNKCCLGCQRISLVCHVPIISCIVVSHLIVNPSFALR